MTCGLECGSLRNRIAIQAATETAGPVGEITQTWATVLTVSAAIRPLRGKEKAQGDQVSAEASHLVTMRFNSTVTPAHRLLFGSRIFDINFIANIDERNAVLDLTCTEAVD